MISTVVLTPRELSPKKAEHLFDTLWSIPVNLSANVVSGLLEPKKSMKKIVVSVGLVAVGASALQAVERGALNELQQTKPWSVQATVRGFYDDNVAATPNATESVGVSISPSVDYGFAGEQTSFNLGYAFTARYYDKQDPTRADKSDYTHTFDFDLTHAFSPTVDFSLSEAFVIGQEPDLIRDAASFQPVDGDNIRNFADLELNVAVFQTLGLSFGYNNAFYDYDDFVNSVLYDRMEQDLRLDSRWRLQPQTAFVVGYTFSYVTYNEDQLVFAVPSDFRDSVGHRVYVGLDHVFTPSLSGSARAGVQYADFINDPTGEDTWSPYVTASLRYLLQARTSVDVGFQYNRTAASGLMAGAGFIRDMESASLYAAVKHELVEKLFLTGSALVRHSTYNAPNTIVDDESFLLYQLGLDLSYEFSRNLSAHIGYNYDQVDDDPLLRDYERNRVYLGVTAGF